MNPLNSQRGASTFSKACRDIVLTCSCVSPHHQTNRVVECRNAGPVAGQGISCCNPAFVSSSSVATPLGSLTSRSVVILLLHKSASTTFFSGSRGVFSWLIVHQIVMKYYCCLQSRRPSRRTRGCHPRKNYHHAAKLPSRFSKGLSCAEAFPKRYTYTSIHMNNVHNSSGQPL